MRQVSPGWRYVYVPFTPPKLMGTYNFGWKSVTLTIERFGDKLLVEAFDSSTNQPRNYVMEKLRFIILPLEQIRWEVYILPTTTP